MHARISCLTLFLVVPGVLSAHTIRLATPPGSKSALVEVTGLDAVNRDKLARAAWSSEQWNQLLSVKPLRGTAEEQQQRPAMLGSYHVVKDVLQFEPRFPLQPGLAYQAVFDPAALPVPVTGASVKTTLKIPAPVRQPSTVVSQVFPTRNLLPENLLKFSVHFSAPMSQGRVYKHLHLLDDKDKPIELVFLELDEELWNRDGTRFTLFIHPGRIKQGLKPREDLGPALEKGKKYTLLIDAAWTDASDQPLKASFRKTFSVGNAVEKCVPMDKWTLQPGKAGTRQPMEVVFPAPLDSALLQHVLWIADSSGKKIAGTISLDREETVWRFTPTAPWQAGEYQLTADDQLEDLAGNNLGKPFEVDVPGLVEGEIKQKILKRSFSVR